MKKFEFRIGDRWFKFLATYNGHNEVFQISIDTMHAFPIFINLCLFRANLCFYIERIEVVSIQDSDLPF